MDKTIKILYTLALLIGVGGPLIGIAYVGEEWAHEFVPKTTSAGFGFVLIAFLLNMWS